MSDQDLKPSGYDEWQEMCRCNVCGSTSKYRHQISPCFSCGERDWGEWVVRRLKYSWFSQLLNSWSKEPKCVPFYEYKPSMYGKLPEPPKNASARDQHDISMRQALMLQAELIELLPNGYEIELDPTDRSSVSVRRSPGQGHQTRATVKK